MRLPFRHRLFLGLAAIGTMPLAVALVVLALQVQSTGSSAGPRAALDEVAESVRKVITAIDTTALSENARATLRDHTQIIGRGTTLARRAEQLSRFASGALGAVIFIVAVVLVGASLQLARRWSLYFSSPIDELIAWVQRIERGDRLPLDTHAPPSPEFDVLRQALRKMNDALERARQQEVERERLVAFRETARRVAHEIRGPLTSSRLAIAQLDKAAQTADGASRDLAVGVLRDELQRLDDMAREFAEFGRLPEGPKAPIDFGELLQNVITATVSDDVPIATTIAPALMVDGHYEPLRRAVQNLLSNAFEATDRRGVEVVVDRSNHAAARALRLRVVDHGPGIPTEMRDQIFEPYYTTKHLGTGLGLAMVKQIVESHSGTIEVENTVGGGATFILQLPLAS